MVFCFILSLKDQKTSFVKTASVAMCTRLFFNFMAFVPSDVTVVVASHHSRGWYNFYRIMSSIPLTGHNLIKAELKLQ